MKAILVLDEMPNSCEECVVRCDGYTAKEYAQRTLIKPNWCPLKPMPKRMLEVLQIRDEKIVNILETSFANGWNACLEELEK